MDRLQLLFDMASVVRQARFARNKLWFVIYLK